MKSYSLSLFLLTIAFCSNSVMGRSLEYLETFNLKDMGVIRTETGKCPWVAIKTPDGYTHYAKIGNFIGENYGKITDIYNNKIRISELIDDGKGDWKERIVFLEVKTKETLKKRELEYLETFDLKDLEIIGVETGKCSWTAINAPNKYVYYARVGNFIGKNDGRIINILEDGIRIEEVIETRQGEFEEKITFIKAKERPKVGNVTHE